MTCFQNDARQDSDFAAENERCGQEGERRAERSPKKPLPSSKPWRIIHAFESHWETPMKIAMYHLCLNLPPKQAAVVEADLILLQALLKKPPLEVACDMRPVPQEHVQVLQDELANVLPPNNLDCSLFFAMLNEAVNEVLGPDAKRSGADGVRMVLCCDKSHPVAEMCVNGMNGNRYALWGSTCGSVAAAYYLDNRYSLWHECLHMLRADDCYDENGPEANPGPTCKQPNCIMQFESTKESVGDWPFLCEENIRRIKGLSESLP